MDPVRRVGRRGQGLGRSISIDMSEFTPSAVRPRMRWFDRVDRSIAPEQSIVLVPEEMDIALMSSERVSTDLLFIGHMCLDEVVPFRGSRSSRPAAQSCVGHWPPHE